MDTSAGCVTVRTVLPVTPADIAEMVLVPAATPVATPEEVTVAAEGVEDDQVAVAVRTLALPPEDALPPHPTKTQTPNNKTASSDFFIGALQGGNAHGQHLFRFGRDNMDIIFGSNPGNIRKKRNRP